MTFDLVPIEQLDLRVIDGDRGKNYPHQDELFNDGDCLFLSAKNVTVSGFDFTDNQFITTEKDSLLHNGKLSRNDIVITTRGTVGNVAYYSNSIPYSSIRINSGMLIVRCGKDVSSRYIYYVLSSPWFKQQIKKIQTGSAQPQLPKSHFLKMMLPIPPLEIQQKIESALQAIDNRIIVNRQINENLLQQLQAIYLQTFDSTSRNDGVLSDICAYSQRRVAVASLTLESYYSTENMLPEKAGAVLASSLPTIVQTTGCAPGDVLISNIRPYFKKIVYCRSECGCSTDVLCFVPMEPCLSPFLFSTLYDDRFFDYMVAGSKGTKMPRGDKQQIMAYPVVKPSNTQLEKFNALGEPILAKIESSNQENKRLSAVRDALLPKLMSGEIDVSSITL